MGDSLIIQRTYDRKLISKFVLDCLNEIVEDYTKSTAVDIDELTDCWVKISNRDTVLAVVQFKPFNRSMLEIHPYVSPLHRIQSEDIGNAVMAWAEELTPTIYKSLITNVPACKRHVMLFVRRRGFKEIGRYESGFKKDGKYHDMVLYQKRIR